MAVFPTSNIMLNGILWGGHQWLPVGGPTTVTYYFAHADEFIPGERDWGSIEQDAYRAALQSWANVANLHFTEVFNSASAGLIEHVVPHTFWSQNGILGEHETPNLAPPLNGYYNFEGVGWDETDPNGGLQIGGFGYVTPLHELGHALGLAHPHDNGGGSSIWPGVTGPFDSYGDNNLNQGIFTVMSYNDGWDAVQNPFGNGLRTYGFEGGPSAFDIAAVQYLYGPNTSYHSGDNTYTLPGSNGPGTYWTCIWDTGGVDQIVYAGSLDVTIDLRAATIDNSPTGGGIPTYASGIYGGFTIANGVVIENARGGSGNDLITGNDVANILTGGDGNDSETGGGGGDTFVFSFDVGTAVSLFRDGDSPNGHANQAAWNAYDRQLDAWHDALVATYGVDLDTTDTLVVAGAGRNAGQVFHFDNSFTLANLVHGDGYDVVADLGAGDHLRFEGMSEGEFIQLRAASLLSVATVNDDTVISWGDGSITLQHQALSFDSLLNGGIIQFA